jgi:hypothetical protein
LKIYLERFYKFGHKFNLPKCKKSHILCELIDKKTLQERHLLCLIRLGVELEFVNEAQIVYAFNGQSMARADWMVAPSKWLWLTEEEKDTLSTYGEVRKAFEKRIANGDFVEVYCEGER